MQQNKVSKQFMTRKFLKKKSFWLATEIKVLHNINFTGI